MFVSSAHKHWKKIVFNKSSTWKTSWNLKHPEWLTECHRVLRELSAVDERDTRHLKGPVKGFWGRTPLLLPHKPVNIPTAPLILEFNRVHARNWLHMQYRKTYRSLLQESMYSTTKLLSDSLEIVKRWVNVLFFVFYLCLRFESCFQTPTISHLYLWQKKHPPTHAHAPIGKLNL